MVSGLLSIVSGQRWRLVRAGLVATAVLGLGIAWWRYPVENHFSIMSCTISFLGSPDANRNPHGWRFYQVGMTALVLLLVSLVARRHVELRGRVGAVAWGGTAALLASLALVFAVIWIPDSREQNWFGMRASDVHTRLAILAFSIMGFGVALDATVLWWSGVRLRTLWPFHLYALLVLVGAFKLIEWERMCRRDPSLPHWPGQGLHSTPLWEWIFFTYFVALMLWMARTTAWTPGRPQTRVGPPEDTRQPKLT